MKPKEKAKELVDRFLYNHLLRLEYFEAKQCALICVGEIYKDNKKENDFVGMTYWQEVKQEINKL